MNIEEKYLPIGTIVLLNGGTKKAMINGFCTIGNQDENAVFDYSGCMYPEGLLSSKQILLFNHNQIEKIFHMGMIDDEEKAFKTKLKLISETINNSTKADN